MDIRENVALAPFTTLGVGGPARFLVKVLNESDLVEAVEFGQARELPTFVLGGGSNLVVMDSGFDGVILQMAIDTPLAIEEEGERVTYTVSAGMDWNRLVFDVCERGISGVECLAGIPGLTGGTPVQNVGAYGQEVADTITSVRALDLKTMNFVSLSAAECEFGYRRSIFNSTARGRYIVTAVHFRFDLLRAVELKYAELTTHFAGKVPTPMEVYEVVRAIRHGKGMLLVEGEADCRSAGSFFKNPVVDSTVLATIADRQGVEAVGVPHWLVGNGGVKLAAAWLVGMAGFYKGFVMGRAAISTRHTLALVNRGGASAGEILALRDEVQRRVKERFNVDLEQEPVVLP